MLSICLLIEFMLIKMSAFWVGVKENWFIKSRVRYTEGSLYRKSVFSPNTGKYGPENVFGHFSRSV